MFNLSDCQQRSYILQRYLSVDLSNTEQLLNIVRLEHHHAQPVWASGFMGTASSIKLARQSWQKVLELAWELTYISGRKQHKEFSRDYASCLGTSTKIFHSNFIYNSKNRSEQVRYWKGSVSLERHLFLQGCKKGFSLISGSCSHCRKCAYPETCRFPTEKRPTIESLGIDALGTLKILGIDTNVAKDPKELFKYHAMILLA